MITPLKSLMEGKPRDTVSLINTVREISQEIVLCGLSRGGFFDVAAFQGGTCLRIFHGLDRFSEDLDFGLTKPDASFDMRKYIPFIENEFGSHGLDVHPVIREVEGGNITGCMMKGNLRDILRQFGVTEEEMKLIHPDTLLRIKMDVDTDTPDGFRVEHVYKGVPFCYPATLMDMPTLFAGKTSATICRHWGKRFKGRDLFDFEWYVNHGISLNKEFLRSNLIRDGRLAEDEELDDATLQRILHDRFEEINYDSAREDVKSFVLSGSTDFDRWNSDHFIELGSRIKMI